MPELLVQLLQEPGHVDTEVLHGLDTFLVVFHLSDLTAYAVVPIRRTDDYHLSNGEEMVHGVKGVDRTASSDGHDSGAGPALEHVVVGARHEPDAVDETLHLAGTVCEIGWRTKDDAIGTEHFPDEFIYIIITYYALLVFHLKASAACDASVDLST